MVPHFDQKYSYISGNLIKAFEFAARAHKNQTRKDGQTPYISHPTGVAFILIQTGCSEKTVIAGLLHDVIEDTDKTFQDIENEFGQDVARLVQDVTIPDELKHDAGKEAYIEHLKSAPLEASLISAADLLYNRADNILDFEKGHNSWSKFPDLPKRLLDFDQKRIIVIKDKLGDHALVRDLERQHQMLKTYFNA